MSDIYINEATGKKIKLYEETWVHVWDEDDAELNFWDTERGVAQWCMENLDEDHEYYDAIKEAYEDEDWELIIKLEGCRYCSYETENRWVVEEEEDEAKV